MSRLERLRVGLVIKEFDRRRGGAERYTVALAGELARFGHEVHVFAHRIDPDAIEGVVFHEVPMASFPASRRFLSFPRQARRVIGRCALDVVHGLTQIYPQDVHRAGGGVHRRWVRIQRPGSLTRWLHQLTPRELTRRYIESRIYHPGNVSVVITNSELVAGHVEEEFDLPPDRIVVVRNGVDPDLFHPGVRESRAAIREDLGLDPEAFVAMLASSNFVRKGVAVLVEAAALARERGTPVEVVVVGGARAEPFARLARRRGIERSVRFTGHVPDVERFYGAADLFVLPTRYDPFANVCLEAMACGLPVVTTAANGASEILEEGVTGHILEDPDDAKTLADRLCRIAEPGRARAMGEAAHEASLEFTPERNARETVAIYRRAIEIRGG
jgi:UDP-glucose:(heptosyl)LPS alpha-1,3-glucosyltransferase